MKNYVAIALLAPLVGCTLPAQNTVSPPPAATTVVTRQLFSPDQLDQLLGSIALYPDPLLALMLPASTSSSDIVLAARYLQSGGDPAQVDAQPWEDAVRGLAHYPQIVQWMDQNLAWTIQLGEAFAGQPDDVMNAIQRLRARAQAAGTLLNTPQQQVVYQDNLITIVPAGPDIIYVPYYDPAIVYAPSRGYYSYSSGAVYGFSTGFATGWWLCYSLDWGRHRVWAINHESRERYWRDHRQDWHRPEAYLHYSGPRPDAHAWHPRGENHFGPRVGPTRPGGRIDDHRDDAHRPSGQREQTNPSRTTYPSNFVGPTAPATRAPATAPQVVAPIPSNNPPAWNRPDRFREHGQRNPNSGSPAPSIVGPTAPQTNPGRTYNPPTRPATEPRPVPSIQRYSPPAAAAPTPAPALPRYTPPAPQNAQPSGPQPAQQQQSSSSDDDKRRPMLVRPH